MRIVDVLVQSAAAYSLALMVAAITLILLITAKDNAVGVSLFMVLNYGTGTILPFVSVRTFGAQTLGNV